MTNYVKQWLIRAAEDLETAKVLLREQGLANVICFHSQQAAEKLLKAFLAYHEKNIRKVHDLESLLNDCRKINAEFEEMSENARYLTGFYVEARYPGDMPQFSMEQAEKAYHVADKIHDFVLQRID